MRCITPLTALALLSAVVSGVPANEPPLTPEEAALYPDEQPVYPENVRATSAEQHIIVDTGGFVRLPCQWEGTGLTDGSDAVVIWKKEPTILLFVESIRMLPEERFRLGVNNSLEIDGARPEDAGTYACSVSVAAELFVRHTVTVRTPAKLLPLETTHFKVREGEPFQLVCRADGVPTPTITWSKLGDDVAFLQDSPPGVTFSIDRLEPRHTGTYECSARNQLGADQLTIRLEVIHAPHIAVESPVVRTDVGQPARLVCKVYANPRAEMSWERNGEQLPTSRNYETIVSRRRFSLNIAAVREEDLTNYTCHARNQFGRSENHVTLTGLPGALQLALLQAGPPQVEVSWSVISVAPLEEFTAELQQLEPPGGPVRQLVTPNVPNGTSKSVARSGRLLLRLDAGRRYRITVRARNRYGAAPPAQLTLALDATGRADVVSEPRLAPSTSDADRIARLKLTPLLLIAILSCFF